MPPSAHKTAKPTLTLASQTTTAGPHRRLILAGQIAFVPTGILTTLLGPMLPILTARWGLNDQQAGTLFPIQFLGQLAGVALSGVMLARVGFRSAFISGLVLMAGGVGTLYLGSAGSGRISIAVYGLGLGMIIPTDNLMIAETSSGSRAAAVSLLNFFWGLGAVVCALLVAWSHAHHLLPAFLGFVSLLLLVLAAGVRRLPFPGRRKPTDIAVPWKQLLLTPALWLFGLVFFLYPGAETCVGGWIGSFVTRMGPREAAMGPMMPAFFWAALTAGRGAAGLVLRRVSEQRALQVCYGLGAVATGFLLRATTLAEVIICTLIAGLTFAALFPIAVGRLSQHYGVQARSIGAIMFSIAALGPAVLPWLVGAISQTTGNLRAGLVVPLASIALLFILHLRKW